MEAWYIGVPQRSHRQEQEQKITNGVVYLCGLIFIFGEWKREMTLLIL